MSNRERNAQIVAEFLAGTPAVELARQHRISRQHVGQLARRRGHRLPLGRPRLPEMSPEEKRHYRKVQRVLGAASAREALGITQRGDRRIEA